MFCPVRTGRPESSYLNRELFRLSCRPTRARPLLVAALLGLSCSTVLPGSGYAPGSNPPLLAARTAAYYDPNRNGEGIFVEVLERGRALVYVFSYSPKYSDDSMPTEPNGPGQAWMLGVGRQTEWGIEVDEMLMPAGGRFAGAYDPDQVEYTPVGPLTFVYPGCGNSSERGQLSLSSSDNAETALEAMESDNYVQLSQLIDCVTDERGIGTYRTGSYFDPSKPGEGVIVQGLKDGRGVVQWMTYDDTGAQMWIQGIGDFDEFGTELTVRDLKIYGGTFWGSDFDPEELTESSFGSLALQFSGCEFAWMSYDTVNFGSGSLDLEALTFPLHINDAGVGCWDY